mmetsp:Transcript_44193/g.53395  ORF Transcript_44193/g.53395 Transcript_44193/m.53395 type:complete len:268 (-) Transcript_44193:683-1486(-)
MQKEGKIITPVLQIYAGLSDGDRQLCFADHILLLQTRDDEKRRRIREARRRAEKAQRDAYRHILRRWTKEGIITTVTRWRSVEAGLRADGTFRPVEEQNADAPREIFEDYMHDLRDVYHRDKSFLNRLIAGFDLRETLRYEEFTTELMKRAKGEMNADLRRVLSREPISSALLLYNECMARVRSQGSTTNSSQGNGGDTHKIKKEAVESEDEGEIVEDGEVREEDVGASSEDGAAAGSKGSGGDKRKREDGTRGGDSATGDGKRRHL